MIARRGTLLLVLMVAIMLLGCAHQKRSPLFPATLKHVDVRLVDSNASSVKLQFTSYVERFERTNCSLQFRVMLKNSRIGLWSRVINASGDRGLGVYRINATFDRNREYTVAITLKRGGNILSGWTFFLHDLNKVPNLSLGMRLVGVDFVVRGVNGSYANIESRFYVRAEKRISGIDVHVKAKPVGTNLLANERWIRNVTLTPEKIETLTCELKLPKDYNYVVTLEVWKNGNIEGTWNEPLVLNPSKPKPEMNKTTRKNFSLSDFMVRRPMPIPNPITPQKKGVGFTLPLAIFSIAIVMWLRKRN